jgi:hypothetical protein
MREAAGDTAFHDGQRVGTQLRMANAPKRPESIWWQVLENVPRVDVGDGNPDCVSLVDLFDDFIRRDRNMWRHRFGRHHARRSKIDDQVGLV